MASHGGILGLFLVSLWYARRHKLSWFNIGDSLVVVAPVGLFLGRCANFINGELYGRPTQVPWAVQFPGEIFARPDADVLLNHASALSPAISTIEDLVSHGANDPLVAGYLREVLVPRHPSQMYEAVAEGLFIFLILWLVRTAWPFHNDRPKADRPPAGFLTGLFFLFYPIARICCEHFREPDAGLIGELTRGQFYSLFMLIAAAIFLYLSLSGRTSSDPKGSGQKNEEKAPG
jgi:phosphatidylglycerol:prolipoprotein diacylglycerol transferase